MRKKAPQKSPATEPGQQASTDAIVSVQRISKSYTTPGERLNILQEISFDVRNGEFLAITGPSGSGKTTLLSLLGAMDRPDRGQIWIDGIAVHNLQNTAAADFRRNKIGFIFQLFYLLPNLTALENVMIPLLPYRRKLDFDLKQRAQELLQRVGLDNRMEHPPARLSGGEQQRVAIARALINEPRIILADEPTGNLDPQTGAEVLHILRNLQGTGKQTLIMVTHDPQIAALADRHLDLEQYRQQQQHTDLTLEA